MFAWNEVEIKDNCKIMEGSRQAFFSIYMDNAEWGFWWKKELIEPAEDGFKLKFTPATSFRMKKIGNSKVLPTQWREITGEVFQDLIKKGEIKYESDKYN